MAREEEDDEEEEEWDALVSMVFFEDEEDEEDAPTFSAEDEPPKKKAKKGEPAEDLAGNPAGDPAVVPIPREIRILMNLDRQDALMRLYPRSWRHQRPPSKWQNWYRRLVQARAAQAAAEAKAPIAA
jgi:hypothetical protein